MKYIVRVIVITLISLTVIACGSNSKNKNKGEVVIIVDSKTYSLNIDLCEVPHEITDKDEKVIIYSISASDIDSNTQLKINGWNGQKMKDSNYNLAINGGVYNGGISYMGDMPYEVFMDKKLSYIGKTERSKKGSKDVKNISIEITATCL